MVTVRFELTRTKRPVDLKSTPLTTRASYLSLLNTVSFILFSTLQLYSWKSTLNYIILFTFYTFKNIYLLKYKDLGYAGSRQDEELAPMLKWFSSLKHSIRGVSIQKGRFRIDSLRYKNRGLCYRSCYSVKSWLVFR